jgi:hypothetical protein
VLLAVAYGLGEAVYVLNGSMPLGSLKDAQWFLVIVALLLSYLLGSILRLNSADRLDGLASQYLRGRVGFTAQELLRVAPSDFG